MKIVSREGDTLTVDQHSGRVEITLEGKNGLRVRYVSSSLNKEQATRLRDELTRLIEVV